MKSKNWCPHCHKDTLFPTGKFPLWHGDLPIDSVEYERWECRNPVCAEAWEKVSNHSQHHPSEVPPVPWHSARKKDGSPTRDPRWSVTR